MTEQNLRDIAEVFSLRSDEIIDVDKRVNEYLDAGWELLAVNAIQYGDGTPDRPSSGYRMYIVGRPRGVETRPAGPERRWR